MYLKIFLVLSCVVLGSCAKADVVVLQNLNTYSTTTNAINGAVYFNVSAPSSLTRLMLFGSSGQTNIYLQFSFGGGTRSSNVLANEISSGKYAFDLSAVAGTSAFTSTPPLGQGSHFLTFYDYTSYPQSLTSAFFQTSPSTSTEMNSSGFTGVGSVVGAFMYQFEGNSTTAIPEPITLILTTSALAAGGVGAWIKRRRQKAAEVVEDHKLR